MKTLILYATKHGCAKKCRAKGIFGGEIDLQLAAKLNALCVPAGETNP